MLDGDGIIPPSAAVAYARSRGAKLAGLNAYLVGNDICLCLYDDAGGVSVNPARSDWLAEMNRLGLKVVITFEINPDDPDFGAERADEQGPLIVSCVKAVLAAGFPVNLFSPTGRVQVFASNDSAVSSWENVRAYFQRLEQILAAAGEVTDIYGQSSVFEVVRGYGISEEWKAPDGTDDVPQGCVWVQQSPPLQPDVGGVTCDVNILTPYGVSLWALPKGEEHVDWAPLKPGDHGQAVVAWQGALKAIGRYPDGGDTNGNFGPVTEEATKAVQHAHGLVETGIADGDTVLAAFGRQP